MQAETPILIMTPTINTPRPRKQKIWQQILASSSAMEEVALRNDWSALNELIESRQQLLQQFFSEPIARDRELELQKIRDDIQLILQHDKRTKALSQKNKQALAAGLKKLRTGKSLLKNYR